MTRFSSTGHVRFGICLAILTTGFSACFTPISVDPQKLHCQVPDDCPAGFVCSAQGSCCKTAGDPLCGKVPTDGSLAETSGDARAKDGVDGVSAGADAKENDLGRLPVEGDLDARPSDGNRGATDPAPDLGQPDLTLDPPPSDAPPNEDVSADVPPDTRNQADLALEVLRDVPLDFPPDSSPDLRADLPPVSPPDLPPDLPAPAALVLSPQSQSFASVTAGSVGVGVAFTLRNDGGATAGSTTGVSVGIAGSNASEFHLDSSTCAGTLTGGATCVAIVSFRPLSSGSKSASLVATATPGGNASATLSGGASAACNLVADSVCPASCTYADDADCKKALSQTCNSTTECKSGYCVDGVCCQSSACGTCMACNLNGAGTCSNKPADAADAACAASAANCRAGGCNGSGACRAAPVGTGCGGSQCENSKAMGFSPGQYVGAVLQSYACDGNSATSNACKLGSGTSCNGYVCGTDGKNCLKTCTREIDCVGGSSGAYHCSGGVCLARKGNGGACATDLECLSRACSGTVCVECLNSHDCPHDRPNCSNGTCIGPPGADCSYTACTFRQACDATSSTCVGCQGPGTPSCPVGSACWNGSCYIGGGRPCLPSDACEEGTCTDGLCPLVTHSSPVKLCDGHAGLCASDAYQCMSDDTGADICQ